MKGGLDNQDSFVLNVRAGCSINASAYLHVWPISTAWWLGIALFIDQTVSVSSVTAC